MASAPHEFGRLLTAALYRIRSIEDKPIQVVQDELGYSIGRESGGSAIEHWRKGHVPARQAEVEQLAREIVRRTDFDRSWLLKFLRSADNPRADVLCNELFPVPAVQAASVTMPSRMAAAPAYHSIIEDLAPFVVGPPITHCRQFFGRELELKRIFNGIGRFPLPHVAVIGPQRSGKTSLLHYLKNICSTPPSQLRPDQRHDWLRQPERYTWVFIDFQDVRMSSQEYLLRFMLSALKLPAPEPCTLISFMDTVSSKLLTPTIMLMDEIGAALASDELDMRFWWSMRSLGTSLTNGNLGFIVASHQPPAEQAEAYNKPSPFFNIFQRLDLGPLTEPAARALIASSPVPFAPADVEWIVAYSGGWPALVQILSQARLHALENGEIGSAWKDAGLRQTARYHYLLEQR
ncbi:MAG TPA: hypothetical protein VFT66_24560 [Roseiflexaceae bacterium]|jgi:hypothetical protein|nr:hypothetical protein [Roseiflexaceae bacterium]